MTVRNNNGRKNNNKFNDLLVKNLYSSPGNEDVLEHFLNAIFEDQGFPPIEILRIENPYNLATNKYSTETICDIRVVARDREGHEILIIVEFQCYKQKHFADRLTYYSSRNVADQVHKVDYSEIKRVVSVCIVNSDIDLVSNESGHKVYQCTEKNDTSDIIDKIRHHIVDARRIKEIIKNATIEDYIKRKMLIWLYFHICEDDKMDIKMMVEVEPIMEKMINNYDVFNLSPEDYRAYRDREMFLMDYTVAMKGERAEGRAEGILTVARNLKNAGADLEFISKNTGLSIEEIKKL